jgi:hypothetical protein
MLYDEVMSRQQNLRPKIQQKAKPMKAGVSVPVTTKSVKSRDALSKLQRSGSTRDAAAVFEQFLD